MWLIATIIVATTASVGADAAVAGWVYRLCAAFLLSVAVVTALNGARTRVVWFKVCVALTGTTGMLLLLVSWV